MDNNKAKMAINFLFRYVAPEIRDQLRMDDEAVYSVTDQVTADKISADLLQIVGCRNVTLCDATACVGGNAFSFARSFDHVVALEIDPVRHEYLQNNMQVLGLQNVACWWEDAIEHCKKYKYPLIFVDPPWGGPNYKQHARLDLYLGSQRIQDAFRMWQGNVEWIALKAPSNFNIEGFMSDTADFLTLHRTNNTLRKMVLYVFRMIK
jgi:16S rRNA G966 N2-methylase RsmD